MRFGILGALSVVDADGTEVRLDGPRQAKALAGLLLEANTFVSISRLAELMWDGDSPSTAVRQVQDAISGLRRRLGDRVPGGNLIARQGRSFRITVDQDGLDLLAFEAGVSEARLLASTGDDAAAAAALSGALAQWRGAALTGLAGGALADASAQLDARRLSAELTLVDLELRLGRNEQALDRAVRLRTQHPFDERLAESCMLAFYRCGRRAEALRTFQELRRVLRDELGIEPGSDLGRLYARIIRHDPDLTMSGPPVRTPVVARVPRLLPADTRLFTGRADELRRLLCLAEEASLPAGANGGAARVAAIDGMAGAGKTALALHAAHRMSEHFPDGQLFVDLQGFDAETPPISTSDALAYLLRAVAGPQQQIPADETGRSAAWRTHLAGSRTLLVLDNAVSAAQIRPLLPASSGCLVIATSRRKLPELDDAYTFSLDVLPPSEALELLRAAAGPDRVPSDSEAGRTLVALCGHMPLAIRISAARLRYRKTLALEDLVAQMRDEHARLASLADDERSLTAALTGSYALLAPAEQRLFRLLGVIPGQDFDSRAAASLIEADHVEAESALAKLFDHNLLLQHAVGRYRFHDLVRAFARALLREEAPEAADAALRRLLAYYEETTAAANLLTGNTAGQMHAQPPHTNPFQAPLATYDEGLAWLRAERESITALIAHAGASGTRLRVASLSTALRYLRGLDGPITEWGPAYEAIALAQRHGDRVGEAIAMSDLALQLSEAGNFSEADEAHSGALALYESLGDIAGQIRTLNFLCYLNIEQACFERARIHCERAQRLAAELGNPSFIARALRQRGLIAAETAHLDIARDIFEKILAHCEQHEEDPVFSRMPYWHLGIVDYKAGRFAESAAKLERFMELAEGAFHRGAVAMGRRELGHVRLATGDLHAAMDEFKQSLAVWEDMDYQPGVDHVRLSIGRAKLQSGDQAEAIRIVEQALASFGGRPESEGEAMVALARAHRELGQFKEAAAYSQRALALYERTGHRHGQSWALVEAGELAARTDGCGASLRYYHQALALARELSVAPCEAAALDGLSRSHEAEGNQRAARDALLAAVEIYRRCGAGETARAAARLAALQ